MTRDDIIRMAREAHVHHLNLDDDYIDGIERFAALVAAALRDEVWEKATKLVAEAAAAEREACARMAEAFHQHGYDFTGDLELHEAIRARGQA